MMIDKQLQSEFQYWRPVPRRFAPDSNFFDSGNIERQLLAKQVALDLTEQEKQQLGNLEDELRSIRHSRPSERSLFLIFVICWLILYFNIFQREVFCPVVGCGAHLRSLEEFEDHYNARHTASCSVCNRVYPTSRLLGIHVSEAHDSFFQAKVARGYAMYECLVEGCGAKLKSYKSRQRHLIDKHKFASSFEFFKKSRPSKKERLKKNQRKQQAAKMEEEGSSSRMQVEEETLDDLVSAVSKLNTSDSSPSAVSFGHRRTRGLT